MNFKGQLHYLAAVLAVFFISRIIYDHIGFVYQSEPYLGYWQFIDVHLLKTDLWRNVFYLHSQPPLMNLYTGVVLQGFPSASSEVFHLCYLAAGAVLTTTIFFHGIILGFSERSSAALSALFMISPSAVAYEHWLTYCYPLAVGLSAAGLGLYYFIRTQKMMWGVLSFLALAGIALTWSLFHLLWLFAIFLLLFYFSREKRKVLLAALLPLLVVFGWYAKNSIVFGEFTATTWASMNLSNTTTFRLPENDRLKMIKTGELSKFAKYLPFRSPEVYLKLLPDTPTAGIPILDIQGTSNGMVNHHHLVYVEASGYYLRDALHVIRRSPMTYLRSIGQSLYVFVHSSSDFKFIGGNVSQIRTFNLWWDRVFYGQWKNGETFPERMWDISLLNVAWWVVAGLFTSIAAGVVFLWRKRLQFADPGNFLILFMVFNIVFVTFAGNLMEIGENNRFRFVVDPFILLLSVFFAGKLYEELKRYFKTA
jgi:hypothetical protein